MDAGRSTAVQHSQGNVNNVGQGLLAAGIGGASAATGFGVTSALGGIGFISGSASGGAGGFVGGAGNAWLGGSSFGQGLSAGLQGAGAGALLGGVSGGISAAKNGGNFWTGKGATFYMEAGAEVAGEGVEYSNKSARAFSDKYFGDVSSVDNLYADGSTGDLWDVTPDQMYGINNAGTKVVGATTYNGVGKGSDVHLFKAAFSSKETLYLTMGHEYIHANLNAGGFSGGSTFVRRQHHSVTSHWETAQAKAWQLSNVSTYSRQASLLSNFRNGIPNYNSYTFPILKSRPW